MYFFLLHPLLMEPFFRLYKGESPCYRKQIVICWGALRWMLAALWRLRASALCGGILGLPDPLAAPGCASDAANSAVLQQAQMHRTCSME